MTSSDYLSGQQAQTSTHPGMGAIPFAGGTAFRVWAPNATQVYVTGNFNDWSETAHPMAPEGNGYWSVDVGEARDGDQYRYFIVNGEKRMWKIDPYARDVTNSIGNGVIISSHFDWDASESYRMPPWNELVIYEMHIGTFNDQVDGPPGNLAGVIRRLPHLEELGVNAIQIMPPAEFAGGFSWGYNTAHPFAIEEDYGGPAELKKLIQEAHKLGIAVIFDIVYNHLGPSDLDLWQFDGWSENEKGGIYFYNDWRSDTPWGPRPDYGRGEVRQYLRDNALMWLEEYHADGLRWDATAYIRNAHGNNGEFGSISDGWNLMRWINSEINTRQPWKLSIAEDLRNNHSLTHRDGARFDSQWDGNFVHPIRQAIIGSEDRHRDMRAVRDAITFSYNNDANQRVIYTESHDEVANGKARVPEEIWPDQPDGYYAQKRSTLGGVLVLTSPGIPMLFQGQEFLEDEWFRDTDPLDWIKKETYRGIFDMYRDLVRLRRNWQNNTRGLRGQHVNVHHVNNFDKVIAFHRWENGGEGDDVVVIVNMANRSYSTYELGFPRGGMWRVRFNSDWQGYSEKFINHPSHDTLAVPGSRDGLRYRANVSIGPYSAVILSQD